MSSFNVWNHVEKRAISYQISDVLDSTVVKAVENACSHFSIDAHSVARSVDVREKRTTCKYRLSDELS